MDFLRRKYNMKVSVIVPVYKAEKSIRKCLDSLVNQSLDGYEVILADDGSPDHSGQICDEYANEYHNDHVIIKAYHKPNGGVSSARQFGIEHAEGEFSIHVDPDDWVEPDMLKDLYAKAKEDNADMLICDFYENTYKGQKYVKQEPSVLNHLCVLKELFSSLHGSTCNKLIRTACYNKYKVRFPLELSFCEDQYVIAALLKNNIKVSYLNKAFYHYVRELNQESLSKRYTKSTLAEDKFACNMFYSLLCDTDLVEEVYNRKKIGIISKAFWWGKGYYSSKAFKNEFYDYKNIIRNSDKNRTERWLLYLSCIGGYQPIIRLISMGLKIKHLLK